MNFGSKARSGLIGAGSVLVAITMNAPAMAQSDLMEMAGMMNDVNVGGSVSLTNDFNWRGMPITDQTFGVHGKISLSSGPIYLGMEGLNYGVVGGTDAVFIASGGWADTIGESGIGYDAGLAYYHHTGDDSLHQLSKRISFFEIYASLSYATPFGLSVGGGAAFDYYHNGPERGYVKPNGDPLLEDGTYSDALCNAANAVDKDSCKANNGKAFWAIYVHGNLAYSITDEFTIGGNIGYYPTPLVDPDVDALKVFHGGVYVSYDLGQGLTASLHWYMNNIPGKDSKDTRNPANEDSYNALANLVSDDVGNFSFWLTKAF